ncbi:MAG: amidase [Bryobacteraceae bacterium]
MSRREAIALTAAAAQAQSGMPELCRMSASALSKKLRAKQVSSREVLAAHLQQIERVNPKVNAIVTLVADAARDRAKQADEAAAKGRFLGPLHGLPIAHKDLQDTKGIRTTYGSPIFKDYIPTQNTLTIERIFQAGAIPIGKTNVPEFGAGSQTFNPVFGATKNPYDLTKTCGGSSGGAAVALACGMVPIADGSDTGGSLRNPASFCGVVGFRSSPGRVARYPTANAWSTISVTGPMARTVADTALFFSAIAGPDPRVPLSIHEPGSRFAAPLGRNFKGVRVAWAPDFAGIPFDHRIRDVFQSRRKNFESLGAIVEDASPDMSGADEAFKVLRALSFYQQHAPKLEKYPGQIKATVVEEIERGAKLSSREIMAAEELRSKLFARFGEFLSKYEYLVLPVTQVPPFDINQPYITEIEGRKMGSYIEWMRSCYYITVTTHPAISVPGGLTSDGLPVGIQIVGRHHADFEVLQLAFAFEQTMPPLWPSIAAGNGA